MPRSCMAARWSSSSSCVQPSFAGGFGVRLGHDGEVALRRGDDVDVALVVVLHRQLDRRLRDPFGGEGLRVALHLQVHADLEELQRRELTDGLGARLLLQDVERPLQAELGVLLDRQREPHVELVVAQVVVADPRVRVDDLRRGPRVLGVDLRGDEHRPVAERAGVEDRRHLTDDAVLQQPPDVVQHLLLGDPEDLGDLSIRPRVQRERALHLVEELAVHLAQRHGGAVVPGAELGDCGLVY